MLRVLILIFLCLQFAAASEKVKFIKAFVEFQNKPTSLVVLENYFDNAEKIQLLGNNFVATMFCTQQDLEEKHFEENPQHLLFIANIKHSSARLANVRNVVFLLRTM